MDFSLYYKGDDMGAVYSKDATSFRVFAPLAEQVLLVLYKEGNDCTAYDTREMSKDVEGTWFLNMPGDYSGVYYCYKVLTNGVWQEAADPYAKACGVNGIRSMVVDLQATNPDGFEEDEGRKCKSPVDAIVCEISVVDTTADESCHAKYPGKYLGMTERGLKNDAGLAVGLDHFVDMGVTHLQIMPSYDFGSIDEAVLEVPQYNWGYDPVNYNVPEGSYSTDPFHGEVRIKEFKQMVQAIHKAGLGVIMDVVYNHTYDARESWFEKIAPGYYYRMREDGTYSNASACGNEIASEHAMVRKYIVDSVCYWAKEYHIDGFRFDLMAVLDIDTMNLVVKELRKINPNIIVYGEGWTGEESTLPVEKRSLKVNVAKLEGVAMFSDDIRDGIKGHVFYEEQVGFVSGKKDMENDIKFSVVGATNHPQVDYDKYTYTPEGAYTKGPEDIVNYVSCHDNLTLWDKLAVSCPDTSFEERMAMNKLAAVIVFTAQGMPFFLEGEEFARTKPVEGSDKPCENSYNMPLYTNSLKYDELTVNKDLYQYYKGIIALRKAFKEFRLTTREEVIEKIHFLEDKDGVVAFTIKGDKEILVIYNANKEATSMELPQGEWEVYLDHETAGDTPRYKKSQKITINALSALVAVKGN